MINKQYGLLFGLLLLVVLILSNCGKNISVAGTSTDTGNAFTVAGVITNNNIPSENIEITLFRINFNAGIDSIADSMQCFTDSLGMYEISTSENGVYNVMAYDSVNKTILLVREVVLSDENPYNTLSAAELKAAGYLVIYHEDVNYKEGDILYIPGTSVSVEISASHINDGFVTLVVPASVYSEINYMLKNDSVSVNILHESIVPLEVQPGETKVPGSYQAWEYSELFKINTSSTGAGISADVYNFPILIRLDSTSLLFQHAKDDAVDLRFSKIDGITELPHDVELWDPVEKEAIIWVYMDTVYANSDAQQIIAHAGNENISSASRSSNVYNSQEFSGVWHLNDSTRVLNAVDMNIDGENFKTGDIEGVIGGAFNFTQRSYVMLPAENFAEVDLEVTVSFWQYGIDIADSGGMTVFDARVSDTSANHQLLVHLPWQQVDGDYAVFWDAGEFAQDSNRISKVVALDEYEGQWNHWSFTKNAVSGEMKIFLNGELFQSGSEKYSSMSGIGVFKLGSMEDLWDTRNYNGYIDEFRVSHVERNATWIKLCYENQKIGSAVITMEANP